MIGWNIFTLTPKTSLIRDLKSARYSFVDSEFINPRILDDLSGWLSDAGDQIVSINITDSNNNNRYFGDIDVKKTDSGLPIASFTNEEAWLSYKYIGRSFSGFYILQAWSNDVGAGIFCNVLLETLIWIQLWITTVLCMKRNFDTLSNS